MPTGVALDDPRAQLVAAAERLLARGGATALTSRAVTDEAGVAKGVLHRHFADFDDFLAALVRTRIQRADEVGERLVAAAGSRTVVGNVSGYLAATLDDVALAVVALVTARDELRRRLRETSPEGLPLLVEITRALTTYLTAEQSYGRVAPTPEPRYLAMTVVGTGHLMFAGELGALPDEAAVREVVESVLVGALRSPDR
ncbi:helix-turn-helix domain-containing protein [Promicromonospora sp. MEB111]|uniref:TetR/AcrR family transcriptional regulator n=1 Tax=Promicromonospora sp. MEB111 TaxID=3040301 RepID=UPI00254F0924|nr:helix-turn-helix domain-containing protein [Promicromonospora sp. MEB111]